MKRKTIKATPRGIYEVDDKGQATIIDSGFHSRGTEMGYEIYDEPGEIDPRLWKLVKGRMRNNQACLRLVWR